MKKTRRKPAMNIFSFNILRSISNVFSEIVGHFNSSTYKSQNHKRKDNSKRLKDVPLKTLNKLLKFLAITNK
jgi:hypothetical protein